MFIIYRGDPWFQVRGAQLKKLRRAKIVGVFRVKNHNLTPKNHIFSNFRGAPVCTPLLDPPLIYMYLNMRKSCSVLWTFSHVINIILRGMIKGWWYRYQSRQTNTVVMFFQYYICKFPLFSTKYMIIIDIIIVCKDQWENVQIIGKDI
jgi:hypothetical protein